MTRFEYPSLGFDDNGYPHGSAPREQYPARLDPAYLAGLTPNNQNQPIPEGADLQQKIGDIDTDGLRRLLDVDAGAQEILDKLQPNQ